jgi:protein SCO1/2
VSAAVAIGGDFALTDHFGTAVTDATYRGKFMLLFFGFTHCRMVCPRALARLGEALDLLGPEADRIQPLYVTVDPERDTPAVMRDFLETRYPRFRGLTGTRAEIDRIKSGFRVFARRAADPEAPDDPAAYAVPHTALTYVMGPDGAYLGHFTDAVPADAVAERLRAMLLNA